MEKVISGEWWVLKGYGSTLSVVTEIQKRSQGSGVSVGKERRHVTTITSGGNAWFCPKGVRYGTRGGSIPTAPGWPSSFHPVSTPKPPLTRLRKWFKITHLHPSVPTWTRVTEIWCIVSSPTSKHRIQTLLLVEIIFYFFLKVEIKNVLKIFSFLQYNCKHKQNSSFSTWIFYEPYKIWVTYIKFSWMSKKKSSET